MIPNQQTSVQYLLNGTSTVYSYPNKIFNASDLSITLFDTAVPPNQYPFTFLSGSQFQNVPSGLTATVTNIDVDTGCTVTLSAAGTSGWTLDLRTSTPGTQLTSIRNQGAFLPDLHEEAFDQITREVQDLTRKTYLFGVHGPDIESVPWPTLPSAFQRQNTLLAFDGSGLPIAVPQSEFGGSGGTPVSTTVVYALASQPSILVVASSTGQVASFQTANGYITVFNGANNITANCTFSIAATVNCTGTVNTSSNTPVVGGNIGYYTFTSLTANTGSMTVRAAYNGTNYDTTISIAKVLAGAPGNAGAPGAQGPPGSTGAPGSGTSALTMYLTNPSMAVFAYANGSVASFAGVSGQAIVLSGTVDVSESCTFSASALNCTGTVNTADNNPVGAELIGYYQITAMTGTTASLTISATYMGATLTQNFVITQAQAGYQIVSTLPSGGFQGQVVFLTTDNTLYTFNGTSWSASVAASNITGQLTASQIATISAAQLTGTITSSQITPGSISTPQLAAGAVLTANLGAGQVTAGTIATGTITAAQIAGGTITGNKIFAGTLTTNLIGAGQITAALINVSSLSALSANMGTVTAGIVQNAGGTVSLNLTTGIMVFNNGSYMHVMGNGFGSGAAFIDWYGPTVSSASNYAACTTSNALYYQTTAGNTYHAGGINILSGSNSYGSYIKFPPNAAGRVYIQQFGTTTGVSADPSTLTFPIAFPTALLSLTANPYHYGSGGIPASVISATSVSGATFYSGGFNYSWNALGY